MPESKENPAIDAPLSRHSFPKIVTFQDVIFNTVP